MRKLTKPKVTESFQGPKPKRSKTWEHLPLYSNKIDSQLEACFLNHTKKLDLPADWNNESPSKLWVYNLHYFEDLLSDNAEEKHNFHLQLLTSWVDQNPVGFGNGWEPYPTSLRIVNILKAWLGGLELDKKLFSSVFSQASFLSNDLEKHLLGNHYFVNLKALLFAGVIFKNTRWLSIAEKGLLTEIPEQILEDGANFELSPMYHSLILVDMLDMFNLSRAYPSQVPGILVSQLEYYIPKMLAFMEAMAHPDGGVSFFNDSADEIAPAKAKIESYGEMLGFKTNRLDLSKTKIVDNSKSGYICATSAGNKLIFDTAAIGPDYIPAHAHADTLSFELSLGKERVFVNSGTSEYGLGESRQNQRKTKSHNTVEIDEKDSSQIWSGFRVAKRARIIRKHHEINSEDTIICVGEHDGYIQTFGGCTHTRIINLGKNRLTVNDTVSGNFANASSYFHFHPDLNVYFEQNILNVNGLNFLMCSDLSDHSHTLFDSTYHPEFGITRKNKVLSIDFKGRDLQVSFIWTPC
ncbi:heparinase II/III family protein [Porticoccaceae bacterium]|nr:heparinase II/III family protein [Porticoccaceae bacterium]